MSSKNTKKGAARPANTGRSHNSQMNKRRLAASIVAIVLALAVFVAYVIEVGMFVSM